MWMPKKEEIECNKQICYLCVCVFVSSFLKTRSELNTKILK